ncbi:MAG: GlxA family transcriptional regulator [Oricola sp.]
MERVRRLETATADTAAEWPPMRVAHDGEPANDSAPHHYAFLLLDQFTHLAFSSALEPLRLANQAAGRPFYRWSTLSVTGEPVTCSNGTQVMVDSGLRLLRRGDSLVVVGGLSPRAAITPRLLSYLRERQAHGARILALCGGTAVLAQAGLLDGQECSVHWQEQEAFHENFPSVRMSHHAFVPGRTATAAGGTAAADLMLHIIAQNHGAELAGQVADMMVYSAIRNPKTPQTAIPARYGTCNRRLVEVLRLMEANTEYPLSIADLATRANISIRQTERLFVKHFELTPAQYYMRIRLTTARSLLLQTGLSVTEIAIATGFHSSAHFAQKYRAFHGMTPSRHRTVRAIVFEG